MEQSGLYGEVNQQPSHSRVWALETLHRFSKLAPTFLSLLLGVRPLFALAPPGYAAAEAATTTTTTTTDTSPASSVTVPTFSEDQAASDSDDLFDEVWKLTSKFYLDRSFGGSDWGKARADLRAQSNLPGDSASETKATKKLLKKLGDKYTQLLSPYMYTEMSRFDPIGAGFMLSIDDDGYFCVSSDPREGSVAAAQNVQKGDKILEIEGVAIKGKSVFDAVDLITKEDKADVRLTIQSKLHPGTAPRLLVLPRDFNAVSNPVTKAQLTLTEDGRKVGYLKLREFNSLAKEKVREALSSLEEQGAEAYIVDLRGNPGGSVQAAVSVASLFLPEDKIVTFIQDATGNRLPLKTQGATALPPSDPIVVWTDRKSASASEILASALHDNCRAVLMGQRTFGKGLVQGVFGLTDGKGLVMTVAKYETPRGASIQGTGILPDIEAVIPSNILGDQDVSVVRKEDFGLKDGMCVEAMASK